MRRSSLSAPRTAQGRRRKTFQASQERDAQILKELLLFVRRKALVPSVGTASTNLPAPPVASSESEDDHDDDSAAPAAAAAAATPRSGGGFWGSGTPPLARRRNKRRSIM